MQIFEELQKQAINWRNQGYKCQFSVIKEILEFNNSLNNQTQGQENSNQAKFLRTAQFEALEIYWFLRLKLKTPKFLELYRAIYQKNSDLFKALGIDIRNQEIADDLVDGNAQIIFDKIKNDLNFVKKNQLQTIYESINLDYPSYILALTMGAGKTMLIATIIATEFAMSLEYGSEDFMKNALIFAPDKTILNSLKEISATPFEKILPARHYQIFMANFKLIYTKDGSKKIDGLVDKSIYNIIVTNTQKIIPKKQSQESLKQDSFEFSEKQKQSQLIAGLRLQAIASLPQIGVFSDEAHHTYGQDVSKDLKRVREAINYIANKTQIICVINTTGTPYFGKQTLKDVVYWYGLEQGIKDNVLKSLNKGIIAYNFRSQSEELVVEDIITDFFANYKNHQLPCGSLAKIAFYFKDSNHLNQGKEFIDKALIKNGLSPSLILKNTEKSSKEELEEFNQLNNPNAEKRVILLIQKGTEGWNCPSLFATALIRELSSSSNFVLQSSTRCLRQVVGNQKPARIYIESQNQKILNKQLEENFRTSLSSLNETKAEMMELEIKILKTNLPKLEIIKKLRQVVKINQKTQEIILQNPEKQGLNQQKKFPTEAIYRSIYSPDTEIEAQNRAEFLTRSGEIEQLEIVNNFFDIFTATSQISAKYQLSYLLIFKKLSEIYPQKQMPRNHLNQLFLQIDKQQQNYQIIESEVVQALAIIKFQDQQKNDIFTKNQDGIFCHTIRFAKGGDKNFLNQKNCSNQAGFGFHYSPYNFDSEPEKDFFSEILSSLNAKPEEIADIFFTGGLTNPKQTDFFFEYLAIDGKYKNYFPDFVILKKNGEFLIIEIKAGGKENNDKMVIAKEKAVRKIEKMAGNKFKYHIIYTNSPIALNEIKQVENLINQKNQSN